MPHLLAGSSEEVLNENVASLRKNGYPEDQAIAIASRKQRDGQKADDEANESPLAAAAKKAKAVRDGSLSAADAASGPSVVSDNVAESMAEPVKAAKDRVVEPSGSKAAPKAKVIPKFKKRPDETH